MCRVASLSIRPHPHHPHHPHTTTPHHPNPTIPPHPHAMLHHPIPHPAPSQVGKLKAEIEALKAQLAAAATGASPLGMRLEGSEGSREAPDGLSDVAKAQMQIQIDDYNLMLKQCVSWNQTREPRQLDSNLGAASAGTKPGSRVSWNQTREPRQLDSDAVAS